MRHYGAIILVQLLNVLKATGIGSGWMNEWVMHTIGKIQKLTTFQIFDHLHTVIVWDLHTLK